MSTVVEVVVTAPEDWVQPFVDGVVADRLVACVHALEIRSTYRWEGQVEREPEVRLMLHTTADRVGELEARVAREHPYDVPCFLVVEVAATSAYAQWVRESTAP